MFMQITPKDKTKHHDEKKKRRWKRSSSNQTTEDKENQGPNNNNNNNNANDFVLLSAAQARNATGLCANTLRNWDRTGKVQTVRTPTNFRVYGIPRSMLLPEMQREMERKCQNATTAMSTTNHRRSNQRNRRHGSCEPNALSYSYARDSTPKQAKAGDIHRQIEEIQNHENAKYNNYQVVTDIASGINWKRRSLQTLLELSSRGMVKEIVVRSEFSGLINVESHTCVLKKGCPSRLVVPIRLRAH